MKNSTKHEINVRFRFCHEHFFLFNDFIYCNSDGKYDKKLVFVANLCTFYTWNIASELHLFMKQSQHVLN